MRIEFIVVGAQKSGTTALFEYLKQHPSVVMADNKELHYFDEDTHFKNGPPDYAIYHAHFNSKSEGVRGEVTPIYMYWQSAIERIWGYNPRIKVIVLLRNPVERAYSHWQMEKNRGLDNAPFFYAIQHERERCREVLPLQHRIFSYVDRGYYCEQIRRIWRFFSEEQVLIVQSEELRDYPQRVLPRIFRHIGVEKIMCESMKPKSVHMGGYANSMEEEARHFLYNSYENEIRQLELMLDWDLAHWLC